MRPRRSPVLRSHAVAVAVAAVVAGVALAGCGDDRGLAADAGPADAAIDVPDDPFAGMFDGPEDFPRLDCSPGTLTPSALAGTFPAIGLRLSVAGGALHVHKADFLGEVEVPYQLTADDLFIRVSSFDPGTSRWQLSVMDICGVPAPGVLRGRQVFCYDDRCTPILRLQAERFHRLAGEAEGDGLTLLGELALPRGDAAAAMNVRVDGDVAHVVMGRGGLRLVSISDPRAPSLLGHYQPAEANFYNDVKLLAAGGRRYAVLAGWVSDVIDVTAPASPQLAARIPVDAHTLAIEGHHAYLVDGTSPTLWIYDLADPRAPVRRTEWQVPGLGGGSGFHDLDVKDGIAYLSTANHGITIADVSDPGAPRLLGISPADPESRFWHSPWRVTIGGRALVLNGDEGSSPRLDILDADPASPTFLAPVGRWGIPGPISMHNVMASGEHAFMTYYQHGVRVLDLSDPSAPRPIGYFNTWREQDAIAAFFAHAIGLDLDPARRRIYVADTVRGLLILQATAALMP